MDDREFKPDYGRRALFMSEENTQRILSLEKQVVSLKKSLAEKRELITHTVSGLARLSARAEVIHGGVVGTSYNNVLASVSPYISEGLRYTEYIMLSESREKLPVSGGTPSRLFVAPAAPHDGSFAEAGGVQFVSKRAELPAYSPIDGKTVNSVGFCSGSGNILFCQGVLPEGIVKEAGKTLTLIVTVYLDSSFSGASPVAGSEALARLCLGARTGGALGFTLTAGEEEYPLTRKEGGLGFETGGLELYEFGIKTDGEPVLHHLSAKPVEKVVLDITPQPAYG